VKQLAHTYALTGHAGAPCHFFQGMAPAGKTTVCCDGGWATGVFLPAAGSL
jgi:hypothetical protein